MEQFERKVTKIGNSFGITLPNELLRQVGLAQGDDVQVEVHKAFKGLVDR